MLGTHNLSTFLLSSLFLWLTPGTDTMYILARSISQGRQAGLISALGIGSGILVHTLFAAVGLSAILATSAWMFAAIKFAGAAYLIYLGIQTWLKPPHSLATPETHAMSHWQIYRQGVITNVLNPKIAIFFLAFLPQFVDPIANLGALPFLVLGILFVTGSTLWCFVITALASTLTKTLRGNIRFSRWLERITGCVYIALGLNLLRSESQST
ncbi:MAG: LysE family translocator [Oculatellaceae cyanobacterium Prado106]|nr:LysE family translocator [Oculatellaceae cyanobacterium Prado106]